MMAVGWDKRRNDTVPVRLLTLLLFFAKHVAVLLLVFVATACAGTLVLRDREPPAFRCALGFAMWGEALFALAAIGWLRPLPIALLFLAVVFAGRFKPRASAWLPVVGAAVATVIAMQPPLAFDETLYHLPFVRALAESGRLQFLSALRFPVFPQFQELLCAPIFMLAGDTATHLVSLAEVIVTAALVADWARRHAPSAASLAAALLLSSPILIHLGTILYVDAALTLFIAAGFYALDRDSRLAGLFFGAACSTKYLGGFFAVAALLIVLIVRRRDALRFAATTAAAALPTTLWLVITTGNPLFPFATSIFGANEWTLPPTPRASFVDVLRVPWDAIFARARMNAQPPVTPLLFVLIVIVAIAATREWRSRALVLMSVAYLGVFAFLPRDTRYLVPLLPLVCVAGAVIIARRFPRLTRATTIVATLMCGAYLGWRLYVVGLPMNREAILAARIDGYAALQHAGATRVYVCGGEQLQYFARGSLIGDFGGPNRYERVLGGDRAMLANRLRNAGADYLLVIKERCDVRPSGLTLEYEDARAQLWRVQR